MATHFHGLADTSSVVRRIQRFLKEQVIDYKALAQGIMSVLPLPATFDLVIDRTNWQFGSCPVNFLVLSVTLWGKQAIPLLWKALPKKGASSGREQCDLVQVFLDVFGHERIQSLTADREFVSDKLLIFLHTHGIPFYIRLRQGRLVEWGGFSGSPLRGFFDHLRPQEKRLLHKAIASVPVVIAGTRSSQGDLVLVATNQIYLKTRKILNVYRRRWAVEPQFRNIKTAGINFEDTHIKAPEKLEKIMAITAITIALCVCNGQEQERLKPTPYKKTIRTCLYSTFRRGFDFLRKWLSKNMHLKEVTMLFDSLKSCISGPLLKTVV